MSETSVVHENEAQRRHSRVKIPCSLKVSDEQGKLVSYSVLDLSASGFAIEAKDEALQVGSFHDGKLSFKFETLDISLDVSFQVLAKHGNENSRLGCEFHNLGRDQISTIRIVLTKFLSGEVTNVDDVLSTLSRDNYLQERKKNQDEALKGFKKFKAVTVTALLFVAGLAAFTYVLHNVHQAFIVTHASAAVIAIENDTLTAPTDGTFKSLVRAGENVKVGQALAVVESPIVGNIDSLLSVTNISQEELTSLLDGRVSQTIVSHCNCRILDIYQLDGSFIEQGKTAMKLSGSRTKPSVLARFDYRELKNIHVGTEVSIYVNNETEVVRGKITRLEIPEELRFDKHEVTTILATIEAESAIEYTMINQPVAVKVGELFF